MSTSDREGTRTSWASPKTGADVLWSQLTGAKCRQAQAPEEGCWPIWRLETINYMRMLKIVHELCKVLLLFPELHILCFNYMLVVSCCLLSSYILNKHRWFHIHRVGSIRRNHNFVQTLSLQQKIIIINWSRENYWCAPPSLRLRLNRAVRETD